jgi:cation transport ATPase
LRLVAAALSYLPTGAWGSIHEIGARHELTERMPGMMTLISLAIVVAFGTSLAATYRKMVQNLVWASAYNLVAIPIAGGLLVRWGFDLPMSVGAIAMSASTIIVAANAQLLRRVKLRPAKR